MKNIKVLFAACLLSMATAVNAQFANVSGTSSAVSSDVNAWQGIRFSYNHFTFDADGGSDLDPAMGFELGYVKSFALSKSIPLFLETGANILWVTGEVSNESGGFEYDGYDFYGNVKESVNMFALTIPVNVGYKFTIDDKFSVFPYLGLSLRGNISGKITEEVSVSGVGSEEEDIDMFDSDEGDGDRFQIGWQIGATANYKKYSVGLSYGADFNEIMENISTNSLRISLGYNF